jgi:hypothetical protein
MCVGGKVGDFPATLFSFQSTRSLPVARLIRICSSCCFFAATGSIAGARVVLAHFVAGSVSGVCDSAVLCYPDFVHV